MTELLRRPTVVLAVVLVIYVVGASTFNILPLLADGAAHTLGFSNQQIGMMSSTISCGMFTSGLLSGFWVRSVPWPRAALLALAGMCASNLLAALVHQYWAFVSLQGLAGLFGGSVLSLVVTILSDRDDPSRLYGIGCAMQVTYQIAGMLTGPVVLRSAGLDGLLVMLAALSGLAMLFTPVLPAHGRSIQSAAPAKGLLRPATLVGFVACGLFYVNAGAYWTYIDLMGQALGISPRVVANCIAVGVSAGFVGGVLAWVLGDRFGKLWPIGFAAFLTVGAALLLNRASSVGMFMLAGLLYNFAWNYALAYQFALIGAIDVTGRAVALAGAFANLGLATGPALAAPFITPGDYTAIIWLISACVCLSTALFILSSTIHKSAAVSLRA